MNFSELSKNVSEKCPEVLKAAFQPVEASEVSGDCPTVTKFGGTEPFRSSKFQWPACSECEKQKNIHLSNKYFFSARQIQNHDQQKTWSLSMFLLS